MSDTMIWADGHAVFTCGPNTGHSVKVIAFCASASEAANIAALMLQQRGEAVRMPESVDEARTMAGVSYLYLREHDPKFRRAVDDIVVERDRQIVHERFGPDHDDLYNEGELAMAAACYANNAADPDGSTNPVPALWPWHDDWWKPGDRRRDLVKAGALIVAEIERLDRRTIYDTVAESVREGRASPVEAAKAMNHPYGDLDFPAPNHFDPSKRGFSPE